MIDGINITLSIPSSEIKKLMDFTGSHNMNTGEVLNYRKQTAILNKLIFIIAGQKEVVKVKGSVHYFANGGIHNYDRFTLARFREAVSQLSPLISPTDQVHGLEFGVNLITSFDPSEFIRNLLAIRGKRFNLIDTPGKCIAVAEFDQYAVKIYDKGKQNGIGQCVLRLELKYSKLARLFPDGLQWGQLSESDTWQNLGKLLSKMFEEIIYWDSSIDLTNITERDKQILKEGYNPLFWVGLTGTGHQARKKKRFQGLITKHGSSFDGIKDLIRAELIHLVEKPQNEVLAECNRLSDIPESPKMAECYHFAGKKKITSFSGIWENMAECYPLLTCNNQPRLNPVNPEVRKCPVTGINISNQKTESRFLSIVGLKKLQITDPPKFSSIRDERMSSKWKDSPINVQIREIAHSIRNEYFNPKNNARKAVDKVLNHPALFDQRPFINQHKLYLAGLSAPV